MKEIELIEKRQANEKHFLQEDGTIVAKVYGENVHYLEDGKFKEIDNTLIKEDSCYKNKKNGYNVLFDEKDDKSLMKMEKNENFVNFSLKNGNKLKKPEIDSTSKLESNVIYYDVLDGVDIEYKVLPTKVKETIILKNNKVNKMTFEVDTNLDLVSKNGCILANKNGVTLFKIENPFMIDSNGIICENVFYNIIENNGKKEVDLVLDSNWLNNEKTKFPVYVDPTITDDKTTTGIMDTYIYPGDTNDVRYNQPILKAGVERVNNNDIINRTLIKFNLPTIGTGSEVIKATLTLCGYLAYYLDQATYNKVIEIHRITESWDETQANWNNMNNKFDPKVEAIQFVNRSWIENNEIVPQYSSTMYGDVTNLVKHWYKDTDNYGIMIKSSKEQYIDDEYPAFYSKNHNIQNANPEPVLEISYRNHNGLEDYLDYKAQQFVDGATYVNTYNGNLVGIFGMAATRSKQLSAVLNLVYNTNDVIVKSNGFKFNYFQTVKPVTINNQTYYEYEDGDGTIHYFKNKEHYVAKEDAIFNDYNDYFNENNYNIVTYISDEDELMLKLELVNGKYVITDKTGNKKIFEKINSNDELYYLTTIEDVSNNVVEITLNQNHQITKITDASNEEINFDYNTSGVIVVNDALNETTIGISSNKVDYITTINGTTNINYNNNNIISSIEDVNGTKITYEYYSQIPYRLKKITQYGLNNLLGKSFNFNYGFNEANIVDNNGIIDSIIFNPSGNKISESILGSEEDLSNAYSTYRSYGENDTYYFQKNRILDSNSATKYVKNYIENSSFEDSQNENFLASAGMSYSFSTDYKVTGGRSLKLESETANRFITYVLNGLGSNMPISGEKDYTFSMYVKSDTDLQVEIKYMDVDDQSVTKTLDISSSNYFKRHDVSFYYDPSPSIQMITIKIKQLSAGTTYIDDIQFEEGKTANTYNILDNSDFSTGFSDWTTSPIDSTITDTYQLVGINNNKNKALKINLNNSNYVSKTIPISGLAGDKYDLSFWIKNTGIIADNSNVQNCVEVYYEPIDSNIEPYLITSEPFVPNTKWQFFDYKSVAPYDYQSITIKFIHANEFNTMYITNLFLHKDVETVNYEYDNNGNLIYTSDYNHGSDTFDFDKNNQLIHSTSPSGKTLGFEYDNDYKDRLLNAISSSGISNRIKYDSIGNPISTKIYRSRHSDLLGGLYSIRSKGTDKFWKLIEGQVKVIEDSCSNSFFNIIKLGEYTDKYYKINIAGNNILALKYSQGNLVLSTYQESSTTYGSSDDVFLIQEQKNGCFTIEVQLNSTTKGLLKVVNDTLVFTTNYDYNDPACQFYFELADGKFIEQDATYTADGKYVSSVTDSLFNKTIYSVNANTGLTDSIINPMNVATTYSYNSNKQLTSVSQSNKQVSYQYNSQKMLSKISQNNKEYNLIYDDFLNLEQFKLGNISFITNTYDSNNGNLLSSTYGNNNTISYTYDNLDRIKSINKTDNTYNLIYDNKGNIASITGNNFNQKNYYDYANRVIKQINDDLETEYIYTTDDIIGMKNYKLGTNISNISHGFDQDDNIIQTVIDNTEFWYNYDALSRIEERIINNTYHTEYDYVSFGNRTSNLIKSIKNGNNKFTYKYDNLYNITHIYYNNNLIKHYYYDDFSQLIKEDDYLRYEYIEYTYDNAGNMTSCVKKDINDDSVISTDTYIYSNQNWEDQLTNYNNTSITYDSIGNPLTIGSNVSMTWINGRELHTYTDTSKNLNIAYKYNEKGIRTNKIVNSIETKYHLEGNDIIYEQRGNDIIYYLYDLTGITGLRYNNNEYYFIKNLQNDVIGILDSNYNQIVSYDYDSWGNILSIKDAQGNTITNSNNIGLINPFRYRSYYYDEETELYYLNTRYYNPKWRRFINIDGIVGANGDILSTNLYLYCSNNPISKTDYSGEGLALPWVGDIIKNVLDSVQQVGTAFAGLVLGTVSQVAAPLVVGLAIGGTVGMVANAIIEETKAEKQEAKRQAEHEEHNHNVYTLRDSNNVVQYVGRTTDLQKTEYRHLSNPAREDLKLQKEYINITKAQARGIEQALIIKCKTLNYSTTYKRNNQINGLSLRHPLYEVYWSAGISYMSESEHIVSCN